jgi:hypothetical protein
MKAAFFAGLAGVLVGAGVITLGGRPPGATKPALAQSASAPAVPAHVPASWDPRYLGRLAAVEARVAGLEATSPALQPQAAPSSPATDRARELEEHYQADLTLLRQELTSHATEPFDATWAPELTQSIHDELVAIVPAEHGFKVDNVDCRSKTCVADLVYDSPDDALAGRGMLGQAHVEGCRGFRATLEPPTSAATYRTSIIYTCR